MVKLIVNEKTQFSKIHNKKEKVEIAKELEYLQSLESADPELTSSIALHSLHHILKESKSPDLNKFHKKSTQILKICKVCDKWDRLRSIKTC